MCITFALHRWHLLFSYWLYVELINKKMKLISVQNTDGSDVKSKLMFDCHYSFQKRFHVVLPLIFIEGLAN